jgi:hypothetical protein
LADNVFVDVPPLYHAALWDGVDAAPIDELIGGLFGADYLGSEPALDQGSDGWLRVTSRPDGRLWFRASGTWVIPAGNVLIYGPMYGDGDLQPGTWQYITEAQFAARFTKVVT